MEIDLLIDHDFYLVLPRLYSCHASRVGPVLTHLSPRFLPEMLS